MPSALINFTLVTLSTTNIELFSRTSILYNNKLRFSQRTVGVQMAGFQRSHKGVTHS